MIKILTLISFDELIENINSIEERIIYESINK